MLVRLQWWRHLLVGLAVAVVVLLAGVGALGEASRPERIRRLQVAVQPAGEVGPDALRVTEVIDQRFDAGKHGPELVVPSDFGPVADVTASSPDAPATVTTAPVADGTRIRIGDADTTISGDHRYRLSYVLPEARLSEGRLAIDAVGATSEIPIDDVTVTVTGLELGPVTCSVGGTGTRGGCTAVAVDGGHRVEVDHLDAHEGITLGAPITGRAEAIEPTVLPPPAAPTDHRGLAAGVALVLGLGAALGTFAWARRTGGNQVAAGGAAAAAFAVGPPVRADLPPPPPVAATAPPLALGPEQTLTDAELAELVTVEFAPPPGVAPWQGRVLLEEALGPEVVTAWFSGAAADGRLDLSKTAAGTVRIERGPNPGPVDPDTEAAVHLLFAGGDVVDLDGYDPHFGSAWNRVEADQRRAIAASGWWRGRGPAGRPRLGGCALWLFGVPILLLAGFLGLVLSAFGTVAAWVGLALVAPGAPLLVARLAYAPLLPGRTAAGSALALRVASFRRFLAESEGQHVSWAWQHGLLRQYSAWAVALGCADAWQRAMAAAAVPPAEVHDLGPMVTYGMAPVFLSSHEPPPPPGSSSSGFGGFSGGGFSGGSVGGGGGGGSHGSW